MKSKLIDNAIGAAMAFLLATLVIMFMGLMASVADAGTVCRVKQHAVAQPVYYAIGQSLREEATATYGFRQSDEYIELQQLRGFKAGVEAVTSSVAGSSSPLQDAPGHPAQPEGGPTTPPAEPAEVPPAAPPVSDFAARYPILAAKCSRCHTGEEPKGDVWIDGTTSLEGPDAAPKRDAIAAAIINGRMPKGKALTDQEQFDAVVQLFTE